MHSFKEVKTHVIVSPISLSRCSFMCQSAAPVAFNYLVIFILHPVLEKLLLLLYTKMKWKKSSLAYNRLGRISRMIEKT